MGDKVDERSAASRGSQPFAWAADIPGKFGAAPTVLFGYTEKLVRSIAAAGGDGVRPFPLYRQPTLTDAERAAVDRARIAFRDMDHNDMTMQQIEDYEAICGLLERLK
jgi:hypothetical protein